MSPWRILWHLATWSQFFTLLHISSCNYWTVTEQKMCQPNLPNFFLSYSSKKTAADYLFCFSPVLYLEGSVLVFEDVFKLVAFYCVSRWVGFIASMAQSFCPPLWSALAQSPVPAQTPLFPLLPFNLPDQKVFQMLVSTVGPDHPVSGQAHHKALLCLQLEALSIGLLPQRAEAQNWG